MNVNIPKFEKITSKLGGKEVKYGNAMARKVNAKRTYAHVINHGGSRHTNNWMKKEFIDSEDMSVGWKGIIVCPKKASLTDIKSETELEDNQNEYRGRRNSEKVCGDKNIEVGCVEPQLVRPQSLGLKASLEIELEITSSNPLGPRKKSDVEERKQDLI
ncbi:hypothetical protein Fmac_018065 [Flemingia macrophylla]|uniref:Uncharacterized protein n=1 Tax=Flemingia macrophylla TaxID=520843 RepID=A0ABD1M3X1_9FABA